MASLNLAGKALEPHYHLCALVKNRREWYEVLGPFFQEGLSCGDKLLHIVNADHR